VAHSVGAWELDLLANASSGIGLGLIHVGWASQAPNSLCLVPDTTSLVSLFKTKSATNEHSQHQARDGARANLAGLGARGPGVEGTYPPDYPSCAWNPPRLPTLWPPIAFIMANWATCGRAERASKKSRLTEPGESRVSCVVCDLKFSSGGCKSGP
jgi:hypothetical protein